MISWRRDGEGLMTPWWTESAQRASDERRRMLSFDDEVIALAVAEGLEVFPEPSRNAKEILAVLRKDVSQ
jgi:hypothetical protein